jgi:hypothetical protein
MQWYRWGINPIDIHEIVGQRKGVMAVHDYILLKRLAILFGTTCFVQEHKHHFNYFSKLIECGNDEVTI